MVLQKWSFHSTGKDTVQKDARHRRLKARRIENDEWERLKTKTFEVSPLQTKGKRAIEEFIFPLKITDKCLKNQTFCERATLLIRYAACPFRRGPLLFECSKTATGQAQEQRRDGTTVEAFILKIDFDVVIAQQF